MSAANPDRLLKLREAAGILGVSPTTLRQMVHRGAIRAVSIAGSPHFKFRPADVQAAIRSVEPRPADVNGLIHVDRRAA